VQFSIFPMIFTQKQLIGYEDEMNGRVCILYWKMKNLLIYYKALWVRSKSSYYLFNQESHCQVNMPHYYINA